MYNDDPYLPYWAHNLSPHVQLGAINEAKQAAKKVEIAEKVLDIPEWARKLSPAIQEEVAEKEAHRKEMQRFTSQSRDDVLGELEAMEEKLSVDGRRKGDPQPSLIVGPSPLQMEKGEAD